MSIKKDNLRKLVDRLRNGTHTQYTHGLRDDQNGRCCLGVACDIAVEDGVVRWDGECAVPTGERNTGRGWSSTFLPPTAMEHFGFDLPNPHLPDSPQLRAVVNTCPQIGYGIKLVLQDELKSQGFLTLAGLNDARVPHPVIADLIEQHWLPADWQAA